MLRGNLRSSPLFPLVAGAVFRRFPLIELYHNIDGELMKRDLVHIIRCHMKMSGLWAGVDPYALRPVLRNGLGRALGPELKARVGEYLRRGKLLLQSSWLEPDYLRNDAPRCVPSAFYTDGEWVWTEQQEYYLREHDILPEPAFIEHMQAHNFAIPTLSGDAIREAMAFLGI